VGISMSYDPERHHRRSIRLRGYDYTAPGGYFITICTYDRAPIFGEIMERKMCLNAFGEIAQDEWFKTATLRPYVRLYEREFVVMPNHVHGIVWIVGNNDGGGRIVRTRENAGASHECAHAHVTVNVWDPVSGGVGAQRRCAPTPGSSPHPPCPVHTPFRPVPPTNVMPGSLGAIVRSYKSAVAKRINEIRATPGAPVWQRNYYEHIIRDEAECRRIREYIVTNPLRWENDWETLVKILNRSDR